MNDPKRVSDSALHGRHAAVVFETAEHFSKRLLAHFSAPGYQPPLLPAVALEVHNLAQKADIDAPKVVDVLQKDPVLAGRVLRIAQSAAFSPGGGITSLRDAVVRLGMRNLSDIALEVSMNVRIFRARAYAEPMEMVRRHSTVCAHLARLVSTFTPIAAEYAFLCGLLHDVGMAAALIVLGEEKDTAAGMDPLMLSMILQQSHQEASGIVARLWRLPMDVQLVLAHHHDVVIQGMAHPLAAIVAIAEKLTSELGFPVVVGGENCDLTLDSPLMQARSTLGFDQKMTERIRAEAQKLAANVERRLGGDGSAHPEVKR
jgi:HD-like signal output (HDOD) protein